MTLLATSSALAAFCVRAASAPWLAVDTEFIRERSYWPRLCLVQLATPSGEAVAVDMMARNLDVFPLWRLCADPAILKVFHAARQDCEVLGVAAGSPPRSVFDTQLAALFCGAETPPSLGALVKEVTGVVMDKSPRMADWSQRPLPPALLRYALDDVTHLCPVYESFADRLRGLDREDWLREECAPYARASFHAPNPEEAWRRFHKNGRGRRWDGETLSALRVLAAVREREAMRLDRPRNAVLHDRALSAIAVRKPRDKAALMGIQGVGRQFASSDTAALLLAALAAPREAVALPADAPRSLLAALRELRARCAASLNLAPSFLASGADLQRMAVGDGDAPPFHGWRGVVFGDEARRVLPHGL